MIDSNNKIINVWWSRTPLPGNFGDILTPWLIKRLFKYTARHTPLIDNPSKVLLGIGSIIEKTTPRTTVWGSGCMSQSTIASLHSTYLAVRGPLTYEILKARGIRCPHIFGDPALLLPRVYTPSISKKYKVGIIPHYVNFNQVSPWYPEGEVKVISTINQDVTQVIDQMLECERIVSSSLHGLIVAHAYNIPATWVKFDEKLSGDDIKFHDYFASQNAKQSFVQIHNKLSLDELIKLNYFLPDKFDDMKLLRAFPVKI
jgi:hypothetical protein